MILTLPWTISQCSTPVFIHSFIHSPAALYIPGTVMVSQTERSQSLCSGVILSCYSYPTKHVNLVQFKVTSRPEES